MDDFAELEINLATAGLTGCRAQLRFRPANSQSEIRLGLMKNEQGQVIKLGKLGDALLDPEAYGMALSAALFSNSDFRQSFSETLASAAATNANLRLRLWVDSATSPLHDMAWETLVNPKDGTRLGMGERILFSRGLSTLAAAAPVLKPPEDATVLLAVASPSDLAAFKLATIDTRLELARAQTNLAGLGSLRCLPDGAGMRVTADDLFAELARGVDILYLVCHGTLGSGEAQLWLEGSDGKTHLMTATDFVTRMRGLPCMPALVVLMSCQSAGGRPGQAWRAVGPRLVNAGVGAVLAMQANISMASEKEFVPRFFQSLRQYGEADRALSYARSFIGGQPDWWVPALFTHLRDARVLAAARPDAAPVLKLQVFEPETVYIPAGDFLMGSDDPDARAYEKPRHTVALGPYRIGRSPVSNRQYAEFIRQAKRIVPPEMGWAGQTPPTSQLDAPVQGLTWYEAMDYCTWLSGKTGRKYRLPDEAEWEKAARGEDARRYPWGETWDPAKEFAASPYGCAGMASGLPEWTLSLWGQNRSEPDGAYLYPWQSDGRNDPGASKLVRRVVRGAGLDDRPQSRMCFARNSYAPDRPGAPGRRNTLRVVMEL